MTVPSQGGVWGFAPQTEKVGDGVFTPASYNWKRIRTVATNFGPNEMNELFPPEMGGPITPSGPYKRGVFMGGRVDLMPRAQSVQGFLFYALMGDVSSVTGVNMDGAAHAGVNTHIFRPNTTNSYYQPWLAVRDAIPGEEVWGQTGYDCKIASTRINIPASGKVSMMMQVVGRVPFFEEDGVWTWDNALEDFSTVPQSCDGYLTLGDQGPAVIGATIDIVNGLTTPQQEMIVGSRFPDDFVALQRMVSIRIITKWANPDLLQLALTGSASGTDWGTEVYRTQTVGAQWAFKAEFLSPEQIAATGQYYGMQFRANDVAWIPDGPPNMQAGGFVTQAFTGTVITPNLGDYFQLVLQNDASEYVWA